MDDCYWVNTRRKCGEVSGLNSSLIISIDSTTFTDETLLFFSTMSDAFLWMIKYCDYFTKDWVNLEGVEESLLTLGFEYKDSYWCRQYVLLAAEYSDRFKLERTNTDVRITSYEESIHNLARAVGLSAMLPNSGEVDFYSIPIAPEHVIVPTPVNFQTMYYGEYSSKIKLG